MHFSTDNSPAADDSRCRACDSSNLYLFVQASSLGMHTPLDQCETRYYKCHDCGSLNDLSAGQFFYGNEIDLPYTNFYLDVAAVVDEMVDPIARCAKA
jgi:hypothetical protein